jgi:DNA helicase-2/ATP-dependent DNA helicase PcrA
MAGEIIDKINECLRNRQSFLLSGGAGSGKTYTLMQTIEDVFSNNPKASIACITYTNVAADEIKKRSPYKKLYVTTIHNFLWMAIKVFQKPLKDSFFALIEAEKQTEGEGIRFSDETEINESSFAKIEYRNYRKLEEGVISHDDLIKIALYMFSHYSLLSIVICDKFDYIFVDEYQDTDKKVIEIFLDCIYKKATKKKFCIGFFGDKMQSIYDDKGVGDIQKYIDKGVVIEIFKQDNYRCSKMVISLINKIRDDEIKQKPSLRDEEGNVLNKEGNVSFLYSDQTDFDLNSIKSSSFFSGWDFNNHQKTKVLFLTHRLIAIRYGFAELLKAYSDLNYTDNLTGNETDVLASYLLNIGGAIYNFNKKNYNALIIGLQYKITSHQKKVDLSRFLGGFSNYPSKTIGETIDEFDKNGIVKPDDRINEYIKEKADLASSVKSLPFSQLSAYYEYYNDLSPYSTQHGVKGAEFDNVLIILDNGKWNKYNFQYYFEKTSGKESIIERTKKLFYVCCSRARNDLVVYVYRPSSGLINSSKSIFGDENVHKI